MIKSFRNKALAALWETGKTGKIDAKMHRRILARLTSLDAAGKPEDMNIVGYDFHGLRGFDPTRYTVHINGHGASPSNSWTEMPTAWTSSSTTR
jgi:proteic killer suppression protein